MLLVAGCAGASVQGGGDSLSARDGARIWSAACDNCHNLRQATEYSAGEWPVIVKHMRTRAGLTRSQADAVAAFLVQAAERAQGS
jgi:nitrate/TMAO reductase-like tetraheme cytochrome c subunit